MERTLTYAARKSVKVEVNFVDGSLAPLTNALNPVTQKRLPAAGWVSCGLGKGVNIINYNVTNLEETQDKEYYDSVAAHEVCHVALGDACKVSDPTMEARANACGEELRK